VIVFKFKKEIKGECTIKGFEGQINAESLQFGVGRGVSSPSGGAGKREVSEPSMSELVLTRTADLASAELFFQSCGGQTLELATISILQVESGEPKAFLIIELTDPLVTSYNASSGGENPTESISLNYTKISYAFNSFDGKKVTSGTPKKWDLAKNATF